VTTGKACTHAYELVVAGTLQPPEPTPYPLGRAREALAALLGAAWPGKPFWCPKIPLVFVL